MSAFPPWAAIRDADRLDRSWSEHRARWSPDAAGDVPWMGIVYAFPAVPLVVRALGGDASSRWWAIAVALGIAIPASVAADRIARRTPFEALRFPDPAALLVARFLRRTLWLTWAGACLAALRVVQMTDAGTGSVAARALAGALLSLAPACYLAMRVAYVAAESIHPRPRWGWRRTLVAVGGAILGFVLVAPLQGLFDLLPLAAVLVVARGAGHAAFGHRPLRMAAALAAWSWLVGTVSVACGSVRLSDPAGLPRVVVALAALVAFAVAATPLFVRWAARQRVVLDATTERAAAERPTAPDTSAEPRTRDSAPLPRAVPGVGPWRAAWRRRLLLWRRGLPTLPWAWAFWAPLMVPLCALWFGRAVLGAAALVLFSADAGTLWIPCAAAVALFAPTIAASESRERLFLLGVDARERVLLDLRAFALCGALPAVVAGAVAAGALGFAAAPRGALAMVAAFLLLRAGWRGLLGTGAALAAAAVGVPAAALLGPAPANALPWAAGVALVGAVGLGHRLLVESEASLRAALRG